MRKIAVLILLLLHSNFLVNGQREAIYTPRIKVIDCDGCNDIKISVPEPPYPALVGSPAYTYRGRIAVRITIDTEGKVRSAKAVTGHPYFRPMLEKAALNAAFKPRKVSGTAVETVGVIVYEIDPGIEVKREVTISLGPVNTMAKILPMPQLAKSVDLKDTGEVIVRVKIDFQKGEVLDAKIESGGHPLVKAAALRAAKGAKFESTLPEFPLLRGSGFVKYKLTDFNKPQAVNKKPRLFLIAVEAELNSRTTRFVKPEGVRAGNKYIAGRVRVAVLVNMKGEIVASNAISGPDELHGVSEKAAMESRFSHSPISGGFPIYVKGIIVYNFKESGKVDLRKPASLGARAARPHTPRKRRKVTLLNSVTYFGINVECGVFNASRPRPWRLRRTYYCYFKFFLKKLTILNPSRYTQGFWPSV